VLPFIILSEQSPLIHIGSVQPIGQLPPDFQVDAGTGPAAAGAPDGVGINDVSYESVLHFQPVRFGKAP
jgi:hypothetical protein